MAGDNSQDVHGTAEKLRELFLTKHTVDIEAGHYDERDVTRFRSDDAYVASFIRSFETLQDACEHLHESLKFRVEFGINDLTHDSLPIEIWQLGAAYFHNHDKDGHAILYLQVNKHRKDPHILPIAKRYLAFLLETYIRDNPDSRIVVLFNFAGAGISHVDMDFIRFIINCFKIYYPKLLGYMLMYEMPWLFNAAWKLIKQMLHPESVKRINFVTKFSIQDYIDKDQLWEPLGGTDQFVYKYERELSESWDDDSQQEENTSNKKKVSFANHDNGVYKSISLDSVKDSEVAAIKINQNNSNHPTRPGSLREHHRAHDNNRTRRTSAEDNTYIGRLLTVSPAEELEFVIDEGCTESCDNIYLKNTSSQSVAFKVKTTSPEKYKVRPSSGLIKPGTDTEVTITLQQGLTYQNTVHKDKFLIMAMEVANDSYKSFPELWKSVPKESIMEHRLRCVATLSTDDKNKQDISENKGSDISTISNKVEELLVCTTKLRDLVQLLLISQVILTVLLLLVLTVYLISGDSNSKPENNVVSQCLKDST